MRNRLTLSNQCSGSGIRRPGWLTGAGEAAGIREARASNLRHLLTLMTCPVSGITTTISQVRASMSLRARIPPPMTAWGKARFDASIPGYGPRARPNGNDPMLKCNPTGIPKILFMVLPHEIVQTPERTFMFFEREHAWRQIWTDGRQHPKDVEPTYMGDSIGRWEGDMFVVDSVGFNDKTWLDFYGNPHSEQMHLVERYKRVDHKTLTMQLIIDDPKTYTETWVSDTKIYTLLPPKYAALEELFCVPEEEEAFTRRIREPAAAKPSN